jgi:NCS2 family nucleobase:cation symporter-2
LWVESFPLGFYGPAVLPLLVAFLVTTVESIGDIGATFEASELPLDTEQHSQSVQGGLLADGLSSMLAAVMTSMPNTTFSQNNGVVSMTKCASRHAGVACGVWLIFFGLFGKIAGIITSIPDCVIGGMTVFLFANVFTSGLKIISAVNIESRRNRFIIAMSMAFGLGVTVWPYAFQDMRASSYTAQFWTCENCDATKKGVRNAISIFMSTGYCVGTIVALLLDAILPADAEVTRETPAVPDTSDALPDAKL